jgi:hypothetical protein
LTYVEKARMYFLSLSTKTYGMDKSSDGCICRHLCLITLSFITIYIYSNNCSAMFEKSTVEHCTKLEATFLVPSQIPMTKLVVWRSRQFSLLIYIQYFLLWFAVALKCNTWLIRMMKGNVTGFSEHLHDLVGYA